jgi:hypothetical protein
MTLKILAISFWIFMQHGHISMTSVDYVQGTDSLKVVCRMDFNDFLNDLQTIDDDRNLKRLFGKQPFPSDLINMYFNSKFYIYTNGKLLIGKLLSANLDENDIILNLMYRVNNKPKKMTVRNLILTGWYTDQKNLMIIRINKFEKGINLDSEHNVETFTVK